MPPKKIIARFIEVGEGGRVVLRREADGQVTRTPVIKTKPARQPRLRRQTLSKRPDRKTF